MLLRTLLIVGATASTATAQVNVRVSDVAHFKGPRINRLQGMGLVVGLAGTGDGGDYQAMVRPLMNYLKHYANPVASSAELEDTKNVAVVTLQATIPDGGVREGDRIDVKVSAIGNCKSLAGGRLITSPLQPDALPLDRTIMGKASGAIELVDGQTEVNGTIRGGLVLERDVIVRFMALGSELPAGMGSGWVKPDTHYVTLVIDGPHQGNGMAAAIAETINAELGGLYENVQLAMAVNMSNVLVRVPAEEAANPVPWMRDIEEFTPLLGEQGARILINRQKQIIVVDGEVRISPVTFSVRGLTINVLREVNADADATPLIEQQRFVALDPQRQGGPTLNRLVQQLNQIQVPIEDRINVIEELQRAGKIHARILYED
jgi:flagellar P-ring protein precursor FlgI